MDAYTIQKANQELENAVKAYLYKDENGNYVMRERDRLPLYLQGAPGVGKTQIVLEVARNLGIGFVSFSLAHHSRNTVLGLPVIEGINGTDQEKCTRYTMSELLAAVYEEVKKGHKEGIILLDEFPSCAESIMPIMLQFLQTKNIGRYALPTGWVIVVCGNPPKYNKSARRFDAAILDRLRLIDIGVSSRDFLKYAKERGVHPHVIRYLELYPNNCFRYGQSEERSELITARGWENLSETMKVYEKLGIEVTYEIIAEFIKCEEVARDFAGFLSQFGSQNELEQEEYETILAGNAPEEYVEWFKELGVRNAYKRLEYTVQFLFAGSGTVYDDTKEQEAFAKRFDHVLEFSERVDQSHLLSQKLMKKYEENEEILRAMAYFPQPVFAEKCKMKYDFMPKPVGKTSVAKMALCGGH